MLHLKRIVRKDLKDKWYDMWFLGRVCLHNLWHSLSVIKSKIGEVGRSCCGHLINATFAGLRQIGRMQFNVEPLHNPSNYCRTLIVRGLLLSWLSTLNNNSPGAHFLVGLSKRRRSLLTDIKASGWRGWMLKTVAVSHDIYVGSLANHWYMLSYHNMKAIPYKLDSHIVGC